MLEHSLAAESWGNDEDRFIDRVQEEESDPDQGSSDEDWSPGLILEIQHGTTATIYSMIN